MFKINAFVLVALPLLAASSLAGAAQRDAHDDGFETSYLGANAPVSTLSRAQVQADYLRAKTAGELGFQSGFDNVAVTPVMSVLTRMAVQQEYQRARMAGEVSNANSDFGAPQYLRATR